jgi:hypothetical protein
MESLEIVVFGISAKANGVVAIVALTTVIITFLALRRRRLDRLRRVHWRWWQRLHKRPAQKNPVISDSRTKLSPTEVELPHSDSSGIAALAPHHLPTVRTHAE